MKQRIRFHFSKTGDLVWISHHDVMRLWERALRRSGLPVRLNDGFNPRPRISLPLALGIGISSADEVIEVELDRWMTAGQIEEALAPCLPAGLALGGMDVVGPSEKGQVERVDYEIDLAGPEAEALAVRLPQVTAQEKIEVVRQRNGKAIDLKPYLLSARIDGGTFRFSFRVAPEGTARPEEFCQAVGLDTGPMPVRIRKSKTVLRAQGPATPAPRGRRTQHGRGRR